MWDVNAPNDPNIKMAEGDYGVVLPFKWHGITFGATDSVSVHIKAKYNDADDIIQLDYTNLQENIVPVILTSEQSAKLPVGNYIYYMDWYHNGVFMCNLIRGATLKVVDKG